MSGVRIFFYLYWQNSPLIRLDGDVKIYKSLQIFRLSVMCLGFMKSNLITLELREEGHKLWQILKDRFNGHQAFLWASYSGCNMICYIVTIENRKKESLSYRKNLQVWLSVSAAWKGKYNMTMLQRNQTLDSLLKTLHCSTTRSLDLLLSHT